MEASILFVKYSETSNLFSNQFLHVQVIFSEHEADRQLHSGSASIFSSSGYNRLLSGNLRTIVIYNTISDFRE